MRHVLEIRPDIIKLDRTLITGINRDHYKEALGAAIIDFAGRIGAAIVAEGIETRAEFEAVTALGMNSGQGFLLGRPTTDPKDWGRWDTPPWIPAENPGQTGKAQAHARR